MGTYLTGSDLRTQQTATSSMNAANRWFEGVNPAASQNASGEGLLAQAYALSLTTLYR